MPASHPPSRRRVVARGSSLIEVMAAIAVMLVGAAGIAGLNKMGMRLEGDGRRITRATAIAEDLIEQIALWDYNDPRLSNNGSVSNDDDIGDTAFALEDPKLTDPLTKVDHGEADLTKGGTLVFNGIPAAQVQADGYERYWNVSMNDPERPGQLLDANGNGVADGKRIAVIVRYRTDVGWRRIVLLTLKVSDENNR